MRDEGGTAVPPPRRGLCCEQGAAGSGPRGLTAAICAGSGARRSVSAAGNGRVAAGGGPAPSTAAPRPRPASAPSEPLGAAPGGDRGRPRGCGASLHLHRASVCGPLPSSVYLYAVLYLLYSPPYLLCLALYIPSRVCIPPVSIFLPCLLHPPLFAPPSASSPLSVYPPCAALLPLFSHPCVTLCPPTFWRHSGHRLFLEFSKIQEERNAPSFPATSNPRCPCPALCFAGVTGRELTA